MPSREINFVFHECRTSPWRQLNGVHISKFVHWLDAGPFNLQQTILETSTSQSETQSREVNVSKFVHWLVAGPSYPQCTNLKTSTSQSEALSREVDISKFVFWLDAGSSTSQSTNLAIATFHSPMRLSERFPSSFKKTQNKHQNCREHPPQ